MYEEHTRLYKLSGRKLIFNFNQKGPSKFEKICNKIPPTWFISYKSPWIEKWDYVAICVSIYIAFIVPYHFGFGLTFRFIHINFWVQFFFAFLMFIDSFLMFFISYRSKNGKEVKDHYQVIKRHIKTSKFIFDVISLLGFLKLIHPWFQWFLIFKLPKMMLINDKIQKSYLPSMHKRFL